MEEQMTSQKAAPAEQALVAELEEYRAQVEAIKLEVERLLAGLSDSDFNWTPEPGSWSIAQCLDHLNTTGQRFLPIIDRMIERGRAAGALSRGPYRHGYFGNWIVRSTEPPPKMRFKAPKLFAPREQQPLSEVGPAFRALQEQLLERIRAADGINLARVKAPSPVTRLLKMSLGQWLGMVLAHERRHLWQARQVRDHPRFPSKNISA